MPINKNKNEKETIRGIPMTDKLWDAIAELAKENGRATSREAAAILKAAVVNGGK